MPRKKQLTDEERAEIEEAFELFDSDKDKQLDRDEFKVALQALGHTITKEKFKSIFRAPEDNLCSWEDYFELAQQIVLARDPKLETEKAFNLMSDEGKIGPRELRKAFKQLGETVSEEEIVAMIEEFDQDGDGKIDMPEFFELMMGDEFS
jgi:centrin-3